MLNIRLLSRCAPASTAASPPFHYTDSVGTRNQFSIAAQWLACTFPCRRFADILADACARLGADVGRYSFIAVDLHHLFLAGLPAHLCENAPHDKMVTRFSGGGRDEALRRGSGSRAVDVVSRMPG